MRTAQEERAGKRHDPREGEPRPAPAAWTASLSRSALEEMLLATARPGILSLALGLPSPDLVPTGPIGEVLAGVLAGDPRALQYGPPSSELRAFIAALMRRRGVACEPEQVFLTAGAQQGMSLLARLLLEPGATVMVEERCYTGFLQAVAPGGPRLVTVPTSIETGIDLDAVERAIEAGRPPSVLYVMPDGHNPMGVSMPLTARRRLVEIARSFRVPIIEDDAYGLISYDGEEMPALGGLDREWVFHVGSFSKTLAPALRTGWVVAPERFIDLLASLKESSDINTATLGQRAVAAFVATGRFDDHLERLRTEYARRRDVLLSAVARRLPSGTRWSRPRAGFFTWVELPGGDAVRLLDLAMERERVAFLPGSAFSAGESEPARSALRLNFSYCRPDLLDEGVARIARALERMGPEGTRSTPDA